MEKLNILLIEDDAIVQHVHKRMLTKLNCEVDIAATGKAALDMIANNDPYHIIFIDIGLPDISGFDVIKQIEKEKLAVNIPIIALTGYAGDREKQACFDAGVTDILHKPVVTSVMQSVLNQYKK